MRRHVKNVRWPTHIAVLMLVVATLVGCSERATENQAPPTRTSESAPPATQPPVAVATQLAPTAAATRGQEPQAPPAAPATTAPIASATGPAPAATPEPTPSPMLEAVTEPASRPALGTVRLALSPVADGLSAPLFVTHADDNSGRLFIVEKTGAIRLLVGGRVLDTPFLDLADRLTSSGYEQGLLGLAFPPDFATSGHFFVNYTDRSGDTIVSRFSVTGDPNVADGASEWRVLRVDQPAANHNGGMLSFGPDGMLWIGMGDGGGANDRYGNGQNPATLLGKMLRLDVTQDPAQPYVVPGDNPWVTDDWNGQDVVDEAWAVGLRNPWRYSFDRATGDLWIADVGQNLIEEINVVRSGAPGGLNFGWPIAEGDSCFQDAGCDRSAFERPVATYNHGADGCSITGGYVYRGQRFPALAGAYLYADFCSGRIWGLDAGEPADAVLLLESGSAISSFGEDGDGELYVTDLGRGTVQQVIVE